MSDGPITDRPGGAMLALPDWLNKLCELDRAIARHLQKAEAAARLVALRDVSMPYDPEEIPF